MGKDVSLFFITNHVEVDPYRASKMTFKLGVSTLSLIHQFGVR